MQRGGATHRGAGVVGIVGSGCVLALALAPACTRWDEDPRDSRTPGRPADTDTAASDTDTAPVDTAADTADTTPPAEVLVFDGARPKNLLVLSIDTLRRDDVGRYGEGTDTPFLDGIATAGVALDDQVSCSSWTLPGIVCALAGRNPEEMGFVPHIEGDTVSVDIPTGEAILPDWLRTSGYTSWIVSGNTYFSDSGGTGVGARFDYNLVRGGLPADGVVTRTLSVLDDPAFQAASPWYLHVHFIDPHAPYAPPDRFLDELEGRAELPYDLSTEEGTRALAQSWGGLDEDTRKEAKAQLAIRYRGELRFVDEQIGLLWSELESRGLLADTLVLVWSDHGEGFFEHGSLGHAGDLYVETTDAIAYFWAPTLLPAAWPEQTTHADLAPTVLAALDLPAAPEATGLVAGMAPWKRPRFQTLWPADGSPVQAVQSGGLRLMYDWDGTKRLFVRDDDPREALVDYDPADPDVVALWDLLAPEVERVQALIPTETAVGVGP